MNSNQIVKKITQSDSGYYNGKVKSNSLKEFEQICTDVYKQCHDSFILLGSPQKESLYIGFLIPCKVYESDVLKSKQTWSKSILSNINFKHASLFFDNWVQVYEITFKDESTTPEKGIDQIFGTNSAFLKKSGLVKEEEEEYEYGFDDI